MFTQFFHGCKIRGALVLFGLLSLTACGGGGGSSGNATTPVTGTSTATVSSSAATSISSSVASSTVSSVNPFLIGGAIQEHSLNIAGNVTTLAGAPLTAGADGIGAAARFFEPKGIVQVGASLYVADNNNTIRRISTTTGEVTTLAGRPGFSGRADGTGAAASFNFPYGIASDGSNLYVTDDSHTVRKIVIATGEVSTLAGTPGLSGSADGMGTVASFNLPRGIATDGTNLYIADSKNHTIRKVVIATGVVTTFAGTSNLTGVADGVGENARFTAPYGITTDGTNLYVVDHGNDTIRKIVIATAAVSTIAGSVGASGAEDGVGTEAHFYQPTGITTDGTNLYVADYSNQTVRKVVIATGAVTTIAGTPLSQGHEDGVGSSTVFQVPEGVTTDGTNLYVTEYATVRKIALSTNTVTTLAGSATRSGYLDGVGSLASFSIPEAITTDGTNLYVADLFNNAIRKIVIASGAVSTLNARNSEGRFVGLDTPYGITNDGTNLYLVETLKHTVSKISIATGTITPLAGAADAQGDVDATGAEAKFSSPAGITIYGSNLYVADSRNNKIRKIVIATGVVTTFAGSGVAGTNDGIGSEASFNYPRAITTDGVNLYVADSSNHTIRKISLATGLVTTLAGTPLFQGSDENVNGLSTFNFPAGIATDGTYV